MAYNIVKLCLKFTRINIQLNHLIIQFFIFNLKKAAHNAGKQIFRSVKQFIICVYF